MSITDRGTVGEKRRGGVKSVEWQRGKLGGRGE